MKIKGTTLPPMHLAVSNDELRPSLTHILIKDGCAFASDGTILAVANLSKCTSLKREHIEMLDGRIFNRDAWAMIFNSDILSVTESGIEIKKGKLCAEIKSTNSSDLNMPDFMRVLKDADAAELDVGGIFSLNPKLLNICQLVIQTDHIVIDKKINHKYLCYDPAVPGLFCLIMGKMIDTTSGTFSLSDFI